MSKRGEKFERSPRDLYETVDPRALPPLLRHLKPGTRFVEPCAGGGALVDQLVGAGMVCLEAFDIHPLRDDIVKADARSVFMPEKLNAIYITNPPFVRSLMHEIMLHCCHQAPSWFLVEHDWCITQQASRIITKHASDIVSIGRLKWFRPEDPRNKGKDPMDNFVWLRLEPEPYGAPRFWPQHV